VLSYLVLKVRGKILTGGSPRPIFKKRPRWGPCKGTATYGCFFLRSLPFGSYAAHVRYQGKIIYQAKIRLSTPAGQQLNIDVE